MEKLTDVEQNILNSLQTHISLYRKIHLNDLADECHVAESTIIKLAKKLGYSGYVEMYYKLYGKRKQNISLDFSNYDYLMDYNFQEQVEAVMDLLHYYRNRKILVVSYGKADYIRDYFVKKLCMFDFIASGTYDYDMIRNPRLEKGIIFVIDGNMDNQHTMKTVCDVAIEEGYNLVSFSRTSNKAIDKESHMNIVFKESDYKTADFFMAKVVIFIEVLLSTYSKKYFKREEQENA